MFADQPFEGGDPGFVLPKKVSRCSVLVEAASLVSFDPDADQIARDIVALLQAVKRVAGEKFLGDLTFEFNAVGSIPSHKLSSFESPVYRSIHYSASVRLQGPTPKRGRVWTRFDTQIPAYVPNSIRSLPIWMRLFVQQTKP